MLSRSQRLSVEQFNSVMEKGKIFHSSLFLARILSNQIDTRISTVTPKKVSKTAVGRNKIRRKMYEAVRNFKDSIPPGSYIIIFAKPTIIKSKQIDIVTDIKTLFVKAGLLR